jgi:hypothetical protein
MKGIFFMEICFDTIDKRNKMLDLLNHEFSIPADYKDCVKQAILTYATKNYDDYIIEKFIKKPQSLKNNIYKINESMGLFKGHVAEWLVCMEYNSLKNKGNVVMTIINPDPTSKADLLQQEKDLFADLALI